jgi:Uma2 family endonuclease
LREVLAQLDLLAQGPDALTNEPDACILPSMSGTSPRDRPYSYADLRCWPDDVRWELIEGEAYAMTGPSWQHQAVCLGLAAQLRVQLRERGCQVLVAPFDVRLSLAEQDDDAITTVVQPDISVVCDASKLDARGCRGAPDLVIEVLSPSTAARDHLVKRALYERHGVREYWLVHPLDRIVTIHRRSGDARTKSDGFGVPELLEARSKMASAGFPGLEIDWDDVFANVSPES